MIYRYPQEVHDFVKAHCKDLYDDELAEACNKALGTSFTASKMKAFRANHGYKTDRCTNSTETYWRRQKKWPKGFLEYVKENSWGVSSKDLAERVNEKYGLSVTPAMMKGFRQRHGIKSGVTGWFQRGHPPANKGKTIDEYMSPETAAKVRKTAFKKGNRPVNELPLGAETVSSFTNGYRMRKKQMDGKEYDRFEYVHRAVWEEHNGPIPEGMCVIFKDRNKMNCDIDNLMLVSKREALRMGRKGYFSECPEATEAGLNLVRIGLSISDIIKKKGDTGCPPGTLSLSFLLLCCHLEESLTLYHTPLGHLVVHQTKSDQIRSIKSSVWIF